MKSSEERIKDLEERVAQLELIMKKSAIHESSSVNSIIEQAKVIQNDRKVNDNLEAIHKPQEEVGKQTSTEARTQTSTEENNNKEKDKEALVGKYLIGALAAMLIFLAASSFVGLVWNRTTPEIKFMIITLAGIALTVLGFWLIQTKKNPTTSIILGTGAGLLFIAILSANLAFHFIGNSMSILLAGIWAVFFILSSRYTNLFFTTIIAYIGSYIALILGLVLMQGDNELLIMILFASSISLVMICKTFQNNKVEFIASILLSMVSFSTILIRCFMDGFLGTEKVLNNYIAQLAVIVILYLLMNLFYKVISNSDSIMPIYLVVGEITTILTALYISNLSNDYLHLKVSICYLLFFIVHFLQFILNTMFYKKIEKWLTRYYAVVLAIATLLINMEYFNMPTGIILIGLLLLVNETVLKRENQSFLISLIILLDSLFLFFSNSGYLISTVYGIIQLGLLLYVLWKSSNLKFKQMNELKTIGILVIMMNSFAIPSNIVKYIEIWFININNNVDNAIGYLIAVIAFVLLLKIEYFKNWNSEQFKFFGRNDMLEDDKHMQMLVYLFSTILYFYGLQKITSVNQLLLQLIFILATIAITLIQSKNILTGNAKNQPFIGVWIVLKYLMLTWTIIRSFSDLGIVSVTYSIAGLIVAVGSISIGFKLRNKSIRQYGLVLTIVMVAKFILVDLNEENSITRVLALIAGGCLCFFISFIYNRLRQNYSS